MTMKLLEGELTIKIGLCNSCGHCNTYSWDPSPSGVGLSAGCYYESECEVDDELPEDCDGMGAEKECPLWIPAITFCHRHGKWYLGKEICPTCEGEQIEQEIKDNENNPHGRGW
jgi:hypothetical protein